MAWPRKWHLKRIGPDIVLQKQYRPPLDKVVIEVPAGLIDAGETAEQAAVRELEEETGYIGVVGQTSSIMFNGELHCDLLFRVILLTDNPARRSGVLHY